MEYANSIKSVALIRRLPEDTSILHKLASGIAEFLSQYMSLFQTTSKSNYDKIVGRYTDMVIAQRDSTLQHSL
ncbi:hypothetical protein H1Q59_01970 [Holosporaceae bacterium 'Namur']|nr:hypothetical protein [Holosporaceae bacterium 'Namur']